MITNGFTKVKIHNTRGQVEDNNAKKISWDSESVQAALDRIEEGYKIKHSPFYEGDKTNWRKGDIAFIYTQHELDEIKKCKKSVVYFANTYCQLMTDNGYQRIKLFDYQEDMVNNFQKFRQNIVLSSRQVGKCSTFHTKIKCIVGKHRLFLYNLLDNVGKTLHSYTV